MKLMDRNPNHSPLLVEAGTAGRDFCTRTPNVRLFGKSIFCPVHLSALVWLLVIFANVTISAQNLPAPNLSVPANQTIVSTTTPTFSWSAVPNATAGYVIAVATSSAALPTDPMAPDCPGCVTFMVINPGTSYTPPSGQLFTGITYYWKVRGRGPGAIYGNWSAPFTFYVMPAPNAQSLSTTPNPPTTGGPFTFTITGNNFYPANAVIVVTDPGGASSTIVNSALTTKTASTLAGSYTPSTAGDYSFVVQNGYNPFTGGTGPQSSGKNVTVTSAQNLPAPNLSAPANQTVVSTTTPPFSWSAVTGASAGYVIAIATSPTALPTNPMDSVCPSCAITEIVPNPSYTPPSGQLFTGIIYYWKVRGRPPGTTTFGNWSDTFTFYVMPAPNAQSLSTTPNPPTTGGPFTFTITGNNFYPANAVIVVTDPGGASS